VLAVVVAEGSITADGGSDGPFGSAGGVTPSPMARAFSVARNDPDIRGVVFRVNSPGGGALAGEDIHRSVELAAERKPIVVSMANVAASGGYYIATPARRVFLNPATITGSIGIYGGKADFSGLHEKLAIGKELYTRGRFAGMLTTARPFTDDERQKYLSRLEAFYGHFVGLVAASRGLTRDSVDTLSRGRVWTGREAVANGLADDLGGVHQALEYLADSLGLEEYSIRLLPENRPWFIMPDLPLVGRFLSVFSGAGGDAPAAGGPTELLVAEEGLIARLPYDIVIE
jgi:protease-4